MSLARDEELQCHIRYSWKDGKVVDSTHTVTVGNRKFFLSLVFSWAKIFKMPVVDNTNIYFLKAILVVAQSFGVVET